MGRDVPVMRPVLAMLLALGTPMNIASFKILERKNIPNVIPLSAARQMVDGDNSVVGGSAIMRIPNA